MKQEQTILQQYKKFKKTRLDFQLVPIESISSLPIPIIEKNLNCLAMLYYIALPKNGKEKISLFRPHSKIIINASNGKVMLFIDYRIKDEFSDIDWTKSIGEFPHEAIQNLTMRDYLKQKDDLIEQYDKVISALKEESQDLIWKTNFKEMFNRLCDPSLIPFLRKIGEPFFNWLDN
jgi:hypothetical protein